MKDKEKQIEEMANMLEDFITYRLVCGCKDLAKKIYDKLLPKDSVVLSKEEYEELKKESADIAKHYQEMGRFYDEKCEECDRISKETAEKILKEIYKRAEKHDRFDDCFEYYDLREDDIEEIAKQFGVEVDNTK